ncbi:hypothetical protein AMS68_000188 [Peltaster fructicola]|uniref:Inositol polyphosphate-related phosphatase domain-containing protein n=1 Tax=Peltaster fructicola TaxID=286661 RepID=A0A6H0XJ58_9PEZI|nr:hypothetical protein AMS68_000188 [Peltaster fructicola]
MLDLNTYIITFNCGREPINTDFFAAHLFDGLKPRDVSPDIIVLCLQEVAPIAYSFLSASMMTRYTSRLETAVTTALKTDYGVAVAEDFRLLQTRNVGMTAVMLFARKDVQIRLTRVDTAGVGVGLWEMGNKGAVGVRLWIEDEHAEDVVPFTFVAAHLAPMESAWERRNEDWRSICERLVFTSEATQQRRSSEDEPLLGKDDSEQSGSHEQGMFSPLNSLFFGGDLNYRTSDVKPQQDDHKTWAAPHTDDFASMLKQDQLTRERNAGKTLHLMDEADVTFPPSYKYSSQAQKQALELNPVVVRQDSLPVRCKA